MRIPTIFALLGGVASVVVAGLPAVADPQRVIDDGGDRQYLFAMSAGSGSFADGRLSLEGVPLVVYFSDRPYRQAGHMSVPDFLALWEANADDLAKDPPNAALAVYDAGRDSHAVVVLDRPEAGEGTLSFRATILEDAVPASFGTATLFIDAFPCAVNGC